MYGPHTCLIRVSEKVTPNNPSSLLMQQQGYMLQQHCHQLSFHRGWTVFVDLDFPLEDQSFEVAGCKIPKTCAGTKCFKGMPSTLITCSRMPFVVVVSLSKKFGDNNLDGKKNHSLRSTTAVKTTSPAVWRKCSHVTWVASFLTLPLVAVHRSTPKRQAYVTM